MKTLTRLPVALVALVALAGLVGCNRAQPPNASAATGVVFSPQDEAAVRATVAELVNIWNHHDLKGMHELVTDDVLWILRNGNVWRGRGEVCRFYDAYQRDSTPWPLITEKMEVRSLAPQVAVATARTKLGQGESYLHTRDSFVMAKRGGAWKIVHFQSTTMIPELAENDRPDFGVTR